MKASNNESSQQADQNNAALLVIDVQQGLFETFTPIYKADDLLQNIIFLVDRAHRDKVPVFYIQHSDNRFLVKGSRSWQLHPWLQPFNMDWIIHKQHGNAFKETSLDKALRERNVKSLIITGLISHGCVKATCLGALELGYKVILVKDGHSNSSKKAAKIIEEMNQELNSLKVDLKSASEIVF